MRLIQYTFPTQRRYTPAPAFARNPWRGLDQEIDRLFGSVVRQPNFEPAFPVDLYEDKENTYVRAELPGVAREAVKVEVFDGQLTVQVESKAEAEAAGENRSAIRTLRLHDDVQVDKISAQLENGILTVTLPKKEAVQPKKVTVAIS